MTISTVDRLRLAAMLGMLGSSHTGERDNAAQAVEQFRRQRGLNWSDLLGRQPASGCAPEPPPHAAPLYETRLDDRGYRVQDLVWRWSMLGGLMAVGLMSLTSLAQHHAAEQRDTAGAAAISDAGRLPLPPPGDAMPAAYTQGLADRRVYETWRETAPPGLCTGRGADRKALSSDCAIARKLLAQFDERQRADPVYRAGWNSLPP